MYSLFQQPPEETSPEPTTTEKTRRWRAAIERLRALSGRVAARLRASIPDRSSVSKSSLFQRRPEETSPDSTTTEMSQRWRATERLRTLSGRVAARLHTSVTDRGQWNTVNVVLAIALALALVFGFHERSVVAHLETQPGMTA